MEADECLHQIVVMELVDYGHDCVTRCRQCGKELWRDSVDSIFRGMVNEARHAIEEKGE